MGFWGSSMLWLCCYQMGPLTPTKSHCMHLALVEDVASVYKMFAPWFLFNEALVLQFICRTIASFSRLYCSDCPDISDGFHAHQRHGLHEHARFEHMNCLNHGISLLQKLVGRKCARSGHLDHCLFLGQVEATRAKSSHIQCNVWSKHSLRSSSVQPWISQWNKSQKDLRGVSHDYIIRRVRMTLASLKFLFLLDDIFWLVGVVCIWCWFVS